MFSRFCTLRPQRWSISSRWSQNHFGAIMIYSNSIDPGSKYNISIMTKLVNIFFLLMWSREKREEFSSHTSNKQDIEAYARVDLDSKWVWGGIEEKTQDMSKKSSTPSFQNGCNYGIRVSRNSLILTKLTVNSTLCIPNCKSFWPL